ncbi:MAG: hypothetical protein LBL30_01855 [Holosporales bacterium]|nr:hypothetical protein [Holosporales bacterium]
MANVKLFWPIGRRAIDERRSASSDRRYKDVRLTNDYYGPVLTVVKGGRNCHCITNPAYQG